MDWLVTDAKNHFSEVVTLALTQEPQRVRRRGQAVVVVSETEYNQLSRPEGSFKKHLFNAPDFSELDLSRSDEPMRDVTLLEV